MGVMTVKLPDRLRREVAAAARRRNVSDSEVVRRAVEQYVTQVEPAGSFVSALELAGNLAGSLSGGPPDLASNPKHLKGYGR